MASDKETIAAHLRGLHREKQNQCTCYFPAEKIVNSGLAPRGALREPSDQNHRTHIGREYDDTSCA
jgi:hypothetical protein